MSTPDEVVRAMCRSWSDPDTDPDRISAYFAEDAVYQNIPMEPIVGRAAIRDFIAEFRTAFDAIHIDIHHQVAAGAVVMNERTDTLRGADRVTPLRVMGFFEVTDGAISIWRDYFDMAAINRAFDG
ncbi:limonene-1,2-epoxide hydrolase family protein [Nocardia sp. NPDC049220]|uniref:limonene-1,2-epoxide hydrolase family protein n=1 Tax=Nocardia sp. NPDC049220 TaxID=3155273 RepID=UPI0033CD74E2